MANRRSAPRSAGRSSAGRDSFTEYVLDQLHLLDSVRARRIFGGHGLYRGRTFFGLTAGGCLYFKTDPETRSRYLERGMSTFRPSPGQALSSYFEVPSEILDDSRALADWAADAIAVAE
ncbi:MAG: TfoX/Sxy family protein, partial [Chloroflexi bacterium]|nr:TfoX/Sxy family protein [Chloroflexota bacterium]